MYEAFFGLKKRPFAAVPTVEEYFSGTACEDARIALARCIERGEGIGMLVGPVGTGKTLLCRKLAEQFQNSFLVAMLASGRLSSRRSLFQAILYELGQPYRGMDEGELRLALVDYLMSGKNQSQGLLLLVDEAHTLPLRLVDEIRMLTNLARAGQPLVRLVLSGNCSLEERLASPRLDSFNSQITSRCYLEAMNRSETAEYLNAKIDMAGGNGLEIFSEGACQSVHQATDGVPRLINQLCDHAMLVAFSAGRRHLEAANIEEAWADLQQLPTPWNGDSPAEKPGVIEFGRLDDMPESEETSECIRMPAPTLRINSILEDSDLETAEPDEQIDSIKQLIAGVEEDFEPAGSIKPEIELTFEEFDHPFKEPFEHEEVVSDRYAAPAALEPLQTPAPVSQPSPAISAEISSVREKVAAQSKAIFSAKPAFSTEAAVDVKKTVVLHRNAEVAQQIGQMPSDFRRETEFQPDGSKENDSMLIVEEDEPVAEAKILRPVRRNEYRRLFAKLRQG